MQLFVLTWRSQQDVATLQRVVNLPTVMMDTEDTGTLAAAWNCETQTLAAAAPGTRRDRPDAQELGNADRGRGGWRRGADQADPSSKPIRETLKYSGTTRPHTAFSRPRPIKTKKMRWLGATHHPNALLCLEMPCQGLFEIRRIDFAKSGEI